jgi:broad specificity phosphatase PhoE
VLIYIRHANDHVDDAKHRHDRHITNKGARKAAKLAKKLIKRYGHPSAIYVSPFRRTLQTATAMAARFEHAVPTHQDPRIAQHFSKKQQRRPDISRETARAGIPIVESRDDLRARVQSHIAAMRQAGHHQSSVVIWCVTHKIVVRTVGKSFRMKLPKSSGFLDYVVIGA